MPIGGKDAFLSKVTFRRESKWYSKTKQELKDMATIEEIANLAELGGVRKCANYVLGEIGDISTMTKHDIVYAVVGKLFEYSKKREL